MKFLSKTICFFIFVLCFSAAAFGADGYPLHLKNFIRFDKDQSAPPPRAAAPAGDKSAQAPAPQTPQETGPSVTFEGEKYNLGYSAKDASGMWLNEYFRPGDNNFSTWTRLIGVYYYEGINVTPRQLAQSMITNLEKTNPQAKYGVSQNAKTGEIVLDFFTWSPDNSVVEFNAFKIGKLEGGAVSMQFARRWYDDGTGEQKEFMSTFKTLRPAWLEELRRAAIPAPVKTAKK